jgi:hypothetical protein
MTAEEKAPFDKIARDKSVRQALMAECVTDALKKAVVRGPSLSIRRTTLASTRKVTTTLG